jgi:bacillithiol biosynthesis cysteine-adding enzyme BshC
MLDMSENNKIRMNVNILPFDQVPQLSERDKAYALAEERLRPFYQYDVSIESFEKVIADKSKDKTDRALLVKVLRDQYQKLDGSPLSLKNIESLLDENTFTVTTAHQPSLFTGPLYYIYKIISTLNLAEQLNAHYPNNHFVPVFITGGEDHDFDEINHFRLFGKKIEWQNDEEGAVGMMSTTTLQPVLDATKEILGDSPNAQSLSQLLDKAVTSSSNYSGVARYLTNELFKKYGLVVLDTNDKDLKHSFIPYIKKEILEQASKPLVEETVSKLEKIGFSEQAYPREINFFYLQDGSRSRIIEEGDQYKVLDTNIHFSRHSLIETIEKYPERFSPNVVMRPIYQELILPNLAYIGGGGELAYWLERKSQFEYFGLNYPMLIRRNSVQIIDKGSAKKMDKLGLNILDLFDDIESTIKSYVKKNTENELSLAEEKQQLATIFRSIKEKAGEIDPTLVKSTMAEATRQLNSLNQLEGKLMRAEKQRHDIAINQMRGLKEKLFPGNNLQERKDNFMNFYLKHGEAFFDMLKAELNPLNKGFIIIRD